MKCPTRSGRSKGIKLKELEMTQFALERAVKRIDALEKQCDGLAKLDKEKDFAINRLSLQIKALRERIERSDSE